jgi:hypothetical protein
MARFPRNLFTVRWLMVAVAVVGLVLGGLILRRRALTFRERAVAYQRSEKSSDLCIMYLATNLRIIEKDQGGEAELQAARYLEGLLLVRSSYRGQPVTPEDMARRFVRVVSPERLATLKRLGHEEIDYYQELVRTYRLNRLAYEAAARRPWLSVKGEASEPKSWLPIEQSRPKSW